MLNAQASQGVARPSGGRTLFPFSVQLWGTSPISSELQRPELAT
jgi:hypothetical protein